jgi:hypothetical protein
MTITKKSHQPRFLIEKRYITSIPYNNCLNLVPTLPEYKLVPPPVVLVDSVATLNSIDQNFVTSHYLPTTILPNKIRIVMADGRISLASHSCTLAMNFSGFSTASVFIITTLHSSFYCGLGLSDPAAQGRRPRRGCARMPDGIPSPPCDECLQPRSRAMLGTVGG